MLWYKAWLETRSRFLIGGALMMVVAAGTVFDYPTVAKLLPVASSIDASGAMGRLIRDAAAVESTYRGFVWWQWFRQNAAQMGTLFAVLLGSGGLLAKTGGGALFTLSLPASRTELLAVRAATGLAEWLILAFVPSLAIVLLSPAIGQRYGAGDVLVHSLCTFVAGAGFFSLALLLSTSFEDLWRPLLVACTVAVVLGVGELALGDRLPYGIFRVMSGELYFRTGQVPWLGLFASSALSAAMLYVAAINFARRDF